jgi:hypothetical protein
MKNNFLVSFLIIGQVIVGCKEPKEPKEEKLNVEFFFGAWSDTTNSDSAGEGFILSPEGDFYLIFDGNISGGEDHADSLRLTYNLHLDEMPIILELISKGMKDSSIMKSEKVWTLVPLDSNTLKVGYALEQDSSTRILKRTPIE